jgi:hypothetical protein
MEARAAAEPAIWIFVSFLAEDFLFEFVLLFLVIRLLFGFQPPELIRERKIGEHERELLDVPAFEKLRIGDGAGAGLNVGFEAVQYRVDLADSSIASIHLLCEVARAGGVPAIKSNPMRFI